MYTYQAKVTSVYDGDTITVDIDLGLCVWVRSQKIRLHGLDAPELRGDSRPHGLESRDKLRELIDGKTVTLRTHKDDKGKYGRWLGTIECDGRDVNRWMIDHGYARAVEY